MKSKSKSKAKPKAAKAVKAMKAERPALRKASDEKDITELMLRDHKPLKRLIKIMKNPENRIEELRSAFDEFAPLLEAHAKPEQESLYTYMEEDEEGTIRVQGFEGHAEHSIADQLAQQIKILTDEDEWKAQVKVIAELVEHHLEEEEEDMIPDLRKDFSLEERVEIGENYIQRRGAFGVDEEAVA